MWFCKLSVSVKLAESSPQVSCRQYRFIEDTLLLTTPSYTRLRPGVHCTVSRHTNISYPIVSYFAISNYISPNQAVPWCTISEPALEGTVIHISRRPRGLLSLIWRLRSPGDLRGTNIKAQMVLGLDGVVVFTHPKTMVSKKKKKCKEEQWCKLKSNVYKRFFRRRVPYNTITNILWQSIICVGYSMYTKLETKLL